jgi:two-component system, NtrC family, nitrogen regulation response regulator GlnG
MHLPPLRDRREDVRVLAEHFVQRYAMELAGAPRSFTESALELLRRHSWPGNVRELENAVKRALVLGSSALLAPEDFAFVAEPEAPRNAATLADLVRREAESELDGEAGLIYHRMIERVERPLIEAALARTDGNQIRAAALLGINRNTLRKKIVELGIELPGRE